MGLFGRRKTYDEIALEEARKADDAAAKRKKALKASSPDVGASAALSHPTGGRGKEDPDERLLRLIQKVLAGRFHRPDPALAAAIEELRRTYAGRPPADAKPAVAAALKDAGHVVPEGFLDMMVQAVTGVRE
jgi:hypothetical protein